MPRYPCYIVVEGKRPGVYENWSDVAVNIRGVKNAIYHGCTSFGDAMRIFKKHQDEGNVRATMPENAMPEPKQEHKDVPVFCSPSRSTSNTARRHHPTHASSDPDTPARGGSRQGTPARGRARAASSTPADDESSDDSPAPANTAPSTRNEARRAGSTTAHSRTGRTPAKDEPPPQRANPSEGTPTRLRNVHVENMTIKASNVSVRSRRHCYSTPSRAAPIRTPRRSSPPQSSSSEEEEDDDAGSVSPFQPPGSASSLGTEVEGESEPEVVSHISIAPSPRRTKQDSQNSAATRRYQPPPSTRQATQATDDSSKMKKTSADPTLPRAQTVKQTNDQQGEESTDDTDSTHLSRSSSPSTFETQYDDGDAPFGYQRRRKQQLRGVENNVKSPSYACGVPLTYPNDSISSALRSKRSPHSYPSMRTSCNTDEDEDDIVPTRPNTPPPSQTANSASQRRSHPAVISIEVCSGCSQVYPNPPLPPPTSTISRSRSGNSIGSSSSHRSIKICAGCYQPLPRATPPSSTLSVDGPSVVQTSEPEFFEVEVVPAPPSIGGSRTSHPIPRSSTQRNALGLTGARSAGKVSSGVGDPRSPLQRSDTLSEVASSPRRSAKVNCFQSLSTIS